MIEKITSIFGNSVSFTRLPEKDSTTWFHSHVSNSFKVSNATISSKDFGTEKVFFGFDLISNGSKIITVEFKNVVFDNVIVYATNLSNIPTSFCERRIIFSNCYFKNSKFSVNHMNAVLYNCKADAGGDTYVVVEENASCFFINCSMKTDFVFEQDGYILLLNSLIETDKLTVSNPDRVITVNSILCECSDKEV